MGVLGEMAKGLMGKGLGGGSSQNPLTDIVLGLITNPKLVDSGVWSKRSKRKV